jgi:PAS domain S-box-containing protein
MSKPGIKRKVLLVLVGVLSLTTALDALLASYFTNQQNQDTAFVALNRSLRAWHDDLQSTTRRLLGAALSTAGDTNVLNQLDELIVLEALNADAKAWPVLDAVTLARGLSYAKSVSLNRLYLALRTSGFSRIAVYTDGKLSYAVSASEAGMMRQRGDGGWTWVVTHAAPDGSLDLQNWPAWRPGALAPGVPATLAEVARPAVSVGFPAPAFATLDIMVPVQGVFEAFHSDFGLRRYRVVSDMAVADPMRPQPPLPVDGQRKIAAVLVFTLLLDRSLLGAVAAQTGMTPELFSPDGSHRQYLGEASVMPEAMVRTAARQPAVTIRTVQAARGSYYAALLPWQFDHRTRLMLGLSASRASTLQNIRQTVSAILLASGFILALSLAVGTYWVGRFIDPIVVLTRAVKRIGRKRQQTVGASAEDGAAPLEPFVFVPVTAPDEIGELSAAFNVMTAELQRAFETLEQRVQARTAELRQQTLYLRTLIDTLPLWVWLKDPDRRYLAVNQANAAACGHRVEDMLGQTDEGLWPPDLAKRFVAADAVVLGTRQRTTVEQAVDGPQGQAWMEIYRAPVLDEDGTLLGMVGAAHNVSERKAAEAAREAALAEAVRLARQRSDFLAQMSHELRTPLNAIMGYAQLLRRDTRQLTERQASALTTIYQSGQHLLTLINDILDLSRVEAGKLTLFPAPTDLATFLRVVVDIMRVKAEEKNLLFSYHAAPDLPAAVIVDEKSLRQVLLNLLGNAVKFTDQGEVALGVSAAPLAAAGTIQAAPGAPPRTRLRFEVKDSGIGMSGDQLARLFQPFEQVGNPKRREGGTGLGLAISQKLVGLMGGTIEVESTPERGSRFWFELDLPVASEAERAPAAERGVVGYEGRRRRLLVVDDVPQNRAMLLDMLQALGFGVADAENGAECLSMLDSFQPDLIIMDVMMPVMDGREATRRIRQLPDWSHIPIVHVTASASQEDEVKCYAAGANAFLAKPIEHDLLLAAIGTLLSLAWVRAPAPMETLEADAEEAVEAAIPPAEEIDALLQLVRIGNMQMIGARADYLEKLDPAYALFARRVRALAQTYQSKALAAFVAQYQAAPRPAQQAEPPVAPTSG